MKMSLGPAVGINIEARVTRKFMFMLQRRARCVRRPSAPAHQTKLYQDLVLLTLVRSGDKQCIYVYCRVYHFYINISFMLAVSFMIFFN